MSNLSFSFTPGLCHLQTSASWRSSGSSNHIERFPLHHCSRSGRSSRALSAPRRRWMRLQSSTRRVCFEPHFLSLDISAFHLLREHWPMNCPMARSMIRCSYCFSVFKCYDLHLLRPPCRGYRSSDRMPSRLSSAVFRAGMVRYANLHCTYWVCFTS